MKNIDTQRRNFIKLMAGVFVFGSGILCSGCTKKARINQKLCVKCRLCESACPHGAISFQNGKIKIDKSKCTGCSKCVDACIYDALSI